MSWPVFQTLCLERDGAVTWLRLNRPARLNALTEESFQELAAAFRAVASSAETRVLVLTGNGRGFCVGSDIAGLGERAAWGAVRQRQRFEGLGQEVVLPLYGLAIPTIAAVNGPASGGGLSLALACDIRIASDAATISCGFTGMGLVPDLGATYLLPRTVGLSRACRLVWTNDRLTASEAATVGLLDEVVPAGEFTEHVASLAARIGSAPQLAVRLGRAAMRAATYAALSEALNVEAVAQSLCLDSDDHRERVRKFLQGRASGGGKSAAVSPE